MASLNFTLKVKAGEKNGSNFWDKCGVLFVNTDEAGEITSIQVRHNMFPNVDMVAFPRREKDDQE